MEVMLNMELKSAKNDGNRKRIEKYDDGNEVLQCWVVFMENWRPRVG